MDGKKVYQIEINGIKESVEAVSSLNKVLSELENRIKTLENSNVKVSASSSGSKNGTSVSAMNEEEKIAKQIASIDAKREAYSKEIYQNYLAAKDVLDETVKDQKAISAQERLQANTYTNTMAGMKQELADLKTVMNGTDLGDEAFGKMSKRAGELTAKLKELEQAYGQFGRDVGNYDRIGQGLDKLKIEVGGVVREFGSAREASKTLKNELTALQIQGKGNTKQADELRTAFYRLKSAMDDATKSSQAMDTAMDFMQSFTAMASVGNGLQAFFGFDDNEITKSIQKLVALQGVLNGLESLRKQMETGEGIGSILGKGFKDVDKWTYGLQRANVALRGTGTSARIAAAGIKALNYAVKGLMTLGLAVALDLIVEGVQKLVGAVKDFAKGDADLVDASEVMKNAIDVQNLALEKNIELIKKRNDASDITNEQARIQIEREYAKALEESTKNLMLMADIFQKMGALKKDINLESVMGDKGVTWIGGFDDAIESIDDFIKRWDYLERAVTHGGALKSWLSTVDDAKDEFAHLNQEVGEDFMTAMRKFNDGTEQGTRKLIAYIEQMDKLTGGRYTKAMNVVKFDNEGLQKDIENAWAMIQNLRDNVFKNPIIVKVELDARINAELDRLDPTRAAQRIVDEWKEMLRKGVDEAGNTLTEAQKKNIKKIIAEQEKNIAKQQKQRLDSEKSAAQKLKDEAERVERELNQLRLELMKEGLEKTLAQLAEERRVKLYEARKTGIKVAEQEALIKEVYRKKELEAIKEHNKEVAKIQADMWEQIYRSQDQTVRMHLDSELTYLDTQLEKAKQKATQVFNPRYASYGGTQLDNRMSDSLKADMGFVLQTKKKAPIDEETIRVAKEYLDLLEKIEETKLYSSKEGGVEYEAAKKALDEWVEANEIDVKKLEKSWVVEELKNEAYTKSLVTAYRIRMNEARTYFEEIDKLERKHSKDTKSNDQQLLTKETQTAKRDENTNYEMQLAQLKEYREKGLLTDEKYNELAKNMEEAHKQAIDAIDERYNTENERIEQEHQDNLKRITADGMRGMLSEYRDAYDNISKLQSYQPQKMGGALGDMGIIDFGLSKKNYKEALDSYKELSNDILQEKEKLQAKLVANEISFDDFQQAKRELDNLEQDVVNAAQSAQENLKKLGGEWWGSINEWIQQVGQTITSIMSSIWEAQNAAYEKEMEELDKQIDKYEDLLKKQEDITQEHANNVDSIESELANARGDRRQHLIDQINEEMAAQRASLAQEKKIQKEKEKAEKKKEKEELEQKKRKQKQDIITALINTAMAISMAAVNTWPVPAIPMMAMAAAMGAAQVAAIASQKYAKGGLLEGRSHAEGGIPVGNTGIEVEGHEYVVRKSSTTPNLDLLNYINKSQRKLNLDDFIEFYTSGKVRNSMTPSTNVKFADGGTLPTLNNDYTFDDRLLTAFEDYSNRPVTVSVVDINNRQEAVRNVQVLAGLEV